MLVAFGLFVFMTAGISHCAGVADCPCPVLFGLTRSCLGCNRQMLCLWGRVFIERACASGNMANSRGREVAMDDECRAELSGDADKAANLKKDPFDKWCKSESKDFDLPKCKKDCTTILRRSHIYPDVDFNVGWEGFRSEIGDTDGNYYIGNDELHRLTAGGDQSLVVYIITAERLRALTGNPCTTAAFHDFQVGPESDDFRLKVGSLLAKDKPDWIEQFSRHYQLADGAPFTAEDRPGDSPQCYGHPGTFYGGWFNRNNCGVTRMFSDGNLWHFDTSWVEYRLIPTSEIDKLKL